MSAATCSSGRGHGVWFVAPRTVEIREQRLRSPRTGEVLVEAITSLISSGTEMNVYRGDIGTADELRLPTSEGEFPFPIKYGYQVVGRVLACGDGVAIPPGQRVFAVHAHQDRFVLPVIGQRRTGEARTLVTPLPTFLESEHAAFANLFAVALNGLLDSPVRVGDVVAILGLGVVGSFAAWLARRTAGKLLLIDPLPERRAHASWLGADAVVSPDDALTAVHDLSDGRGADLVIEASGAPLALQTAISATGNEGTVLVLSYYGSKAVPLVLSPEFHYRRQRIISSMVASVGSGLQPRWNRERRSEVAFREVAKCPIERLVSHRLRFSEAATAYRLVDEHPDETLGVLLTYDLAAVDSSPERDGQGAEHQ